MANKENLAQIVRSGSSPSSWSSSLFSHIERGLKKNPHKTAIRCMHQPANHLSDLVLPELVEWENGSQLMRDREHDADCLTLTYSQLHHSALDLASGMIANGVKPGSTVLALIPNGGEYAILLWACIVLRLTLTPLDPSVLEAPANTDLRYVIETINPEVMIVPNAKGAYVLGAEVKDIGAPRQMLLISLDGKPPLSGWKSLYNLIGEASNHPLNKRSLLEDARNDDPNRINFILFTSGTSAGAPKGCPQRVGSMSHILNSQAWLINSDNCSRVLQQAHNSRGIALQTTLQTWREGGELVMASSKSFAIEHTADAILQHRVTFVVLSPAMVYGLADTLSSTTDVRNGTADSVRTFHVGGDAVTRDVLIRTATLFPDAKVCINQGMTEGGGFFQWPFFNGPPLSQIPHFGEICPVGIVAPGASVRICAPNSRATLRKGVPGELHVCCASIIEGYLGGIEQDSFYEDDYGRWFITGDIAMVDEANLVYLLGRSKEQIEHEEGCVIPAVLESCIEKFSGVQATVVAIRHATRGNEAFAVLGSSNSKSEDEIKSNIQQILGKAYVPAGLFSLKQIGLEKAPVNATHKVVKTEVRRALLRHLEGSNK
ncbi:putative NRPS-like protein biosynthetic cluster [Arachnomyces sp. PD_36]|nr:putative NRPS-like protein biosynthetic cluster [Arachnomyces sp. PD_36]